MAFLDRVSPILQQLGGVTYQILIWLLIGSVLVSVTLYILKRKAYKKYSVLIFKRKKDKEGRETLVFAGLDKAAIINDRKLKKKVVRLKNARVHLGEEEGANFDENRNLDVPSIPSEKGGEVIFLEKLGPRKYAFGEPVVFQGKVEVKVAEADVAEAIRAYDINAKYFGGEEWKKWVGPIAFAVFAVLIIVMIFTVLQKFEVLADVAQKLTETAQVIQAGKTSTVPSSVP